MAKLNYDEKQWLRCYVTTNENTEITFDEVAGIMKKYARDYHLSKVKAEANAKLEPLDETNAKKYKVNLGRSPLSDIALFIDDDLNIHMDCLKFHGLFAMSEAAEMFELLASKIRELQDEMICEIGKFSARVTGEDPGDNNTIDLKS